MKNYRFCSIKCSVYTVQYSTVQTASSSAVCIQYSTVQYRTDCILKCSVYTVQYSTVQTVSSSAVYTVQYSIVPYRLHHQVQCVYSTV